MDPKLKEKYDEDLKWYAARFMEVSIRARDEHRSPLAYKMATVLLLLSQLEADVHVPEGADL